MNIRVLVAMSGGVDSSVSAALLVKQGIEVEGATMKLTAGLCCDIGSAQAVCERLDIPHRTIDAQAEFTHGIIEDFIAEYRRGRTPNPCIRCNDIIKFHLLLKYAQSNGFDYLATGHYACIEQDQSSSRFLLRKGIDEQKDQSYFLYRLTQEQMQGILFPLGDKRKTDVRIMARKFGLPAAERPESQDICFVPNNNYRAFLKENAPETRMSGDMVLLDGSVVGRHDGIAFFTVGQRRRLGVAAGERLYVIRTEPDTNRVVLGKLSELHLGRMTVSDSHFIPFNELRSRMNVTVRIRYRSSHVPAVIEPLNDGRIQVIFERAVSGICSGQAAVFYDGDLVVGGGVIETS